MISFFPNRYQDELLYSTISRYKEISGFPSKQAFLKSLYNKQLTTHSVQFPLHIEEIISNMPPLSIVTAKSIIEENTLFPYYTAFISQERTNTTYNAMLGDNSRSVDSLVGILNWNTGSNQYLRYCVSCLEEDILNYGESYWRRIHQIPGVLICPQHKKVLQESNVLANNMRRDYVSPDFNLCQRVFDRDEYPQRIIELNLKFIENVGILLNQSFIRRNTDFFRLYYMEQLKNKNFLSKGGCIKHQKLIREFQEYYSKEYLGVMESTVDYNKENTWLHAITRNTKKNKNPLQHLLLIQFLEINISEMFNAPEIKLQTRTPMKYLPSSSVEWRRREWLQIIDKNPGCNRNKLKEIGGAIYTWIVRYDRKWYETVTPKHKEKTRRMGERYHEKTDDEMLEMAKVAVHIILLSPQKPTRVTELAIKREASITLDLKNPLFKKTYKYIQANVEALEPFRRRKIRWAIKELLETNIVITPYKIESKAGFGSKRREEVRPIVEEILEGYEIT